MSDTAPRNDLDPDLIQKYDGLDAECDDEMIALQVKHMNACKVVSDRRNGNFKMAVAEGMPKEGWRLQLKINRTKRKAARQIANLLEDEEADTRESAEAIQRALGVQLSELPLGRWAVKQGRSPNDEPPDETRPAGGKKARGKKGAQLVGEDTGAAPKTGVDDEPDLRGDRQREQEALRTAETEERLGGMKTLDAGARPH